MGPFCPKFNFVTQQPLPCVPKAATVVHNLANSQTRLQTHITKNNTSPAVAETRWRKHLLFSKNSPVSIILPNS